jgi:type 2 lantibiotic biosynthesis protein lanM
MKESMINYWLNYFPEYSLETFEKELTKHLGENYIDKLLNFYKDYETVDVDIIFKYVSLNLEAIPKQFKEIIEEKYLFSSIIIPFISKYFSEYSYTISRNKSIEDSDEFLTCSVLDVADRINTLLYRSIIGDISTLKARGVLQGKTSVNRMDYYKNKYIKEEKNLVDFYAKFSELTRLTSYVVKNTFEFYLEIIQQFQEQYVKILELFQCKTDSKVLISKIELGNGDSHKKNKSVSKIFLSSGNTIIYKPRSLNIEKSFEKMMEFLRDQNAILDYKLPNIISTEKYGFCEYIDTEECMNDLDVKGFYQRIGELLGILYSLNSVDFHYENIIAKGAYPVPIDLETLIHPQIVDRNNDLSAFKKASKKFESSVITTGLLPIFLKGNEVGGVSMNSEQISTFKTDYIKDTNSDNIHIEREYYVISPKNNNPIINGKIVDAKDYIFEIIKGFQGIYKWIMNNRKIYIEKIYELFSNTVGRFIPRATLYYSQLLRISLSPEFTQKHFERKMLLRRLYIGSENSETMLIDSEFKDLLEADIPYFSFIIGDNKIFDSKGVEVKGVNLTNFKEDFSSKISTFCDEDLKEQIGYIKDSFISRKNQSDSNDIKFQTYYNKLKPELWLSTATKIGDLIIDNSIEGVNEYGRKDLAWISVTMQGFEEDVWLPSVLTNDLYSGNAGISLFLINLWNITGKKRFLEYAKKSVETSKVLLGNKYIHSNHLVGAFIGVGGMIYSLAEIAHLTGDVKNKNFIKKSILSLDELILRDTSNDLISGNTGLLAVILKLVNSDSYYNTPDIKCVISKIVQKILHESKFVDGLRFWECMPNRNYVGFSHGNAGIHSYLFKAMKYLGDSRAEEILQESLNYEKKCFSSHKNDWYRSKDEKQISYTWCHGSPGILLSKLLLLSSGYNFDNLDNDIRLSIENTKAYGFGNNPTYCHGDLGNLEILNYASKLFHKKNLNNLCTNIYQELFDTVLVKEWDKKNLKSSNTYGLMVGLSGWGYSMLSNYTDHSLNNFLWLD